MMRRALAVLFAAGLLGGCTDADWDHALSYAGLDSAGPPPAEEPAAPAPVAAQAAPTTNAWCGEAAKAAQSEAAAEGFDAATQQHRAQTLFAQCLRNPGAQPR